MNQEYEKMIQGKDYNPEDPKLVEMRSQAHEQAHMYNSFSNKEARKHLINEMFGTVGEEITVEGGLRVDYGKNIHVGNRFFANFDCVFLDAAEIRIGDNAYIGTKVSLVTSHHPLDAKERNKGVESARPITIGDNVWIGSSSTIVGGLSLGNNVVVAAGSVVVNSFGDNLLIGGNPARVIKEL